MVYRDWRLEGWGFGVSENVVWVLSVEAVGFGGALRFGV